MADAMRADASDVDVQAFNRTWIKCEKSAVEFKMHMHSYTSIRTYRCHIFFRIIRDHIKWDKVWVVVTKTEVTCGLVVRIRLRSNSRTDGREADRYTCTETPVIYYNVNFMVCTLFMFLDPAANITGKPACSTEFMSCLIKNSGS